MNNICFITPLMHALNKGNIISIFYYFIYILKFSLFHSIPSLKRSKFQVQITQTMLTITMLLLFFISLSSQVEALTSNKLDQPGYTEIKCESCTCGDTCGEEIPPPPPPPPPPLPQPCPPPPPPKFPSCPGTCDPSPRPPPPPPRFIYVPVPGNSNPDKPYTWIYYYSGAENRAVGFLVMAGLGLLSTMLFG